MKPMIFVPFDFSASAERALAWAADLQRTTGAGPLRMIRAINARPPGSGDVSLQIVVPNAAEIADLERSMIEAARRHGAQASAQVLVEASAVGDIILDAARGVGAEVIVMGTHGRTGVKRLFLGSVAEHVLRRADCPVVTVHVPGDGEARAAADASRH